jgi:hypothetical protein
MAKLTREDDEGKDKDANKDRDDLVEAGRKLKQAKAREARQSGLGVGAQGPAWKSRKGKA